MTSRTSLAYLQTLLRENWEEDVSGRANPVPQPYILLASSKYESRVSQYDGDVIFVVDGGPQSLTPKGAGWTHRGVESLVTIDCRTQQGRVRLEGGRNDDNESESHGGLRGEALRIIDNVRKGDKEFDLIDGHEWNDLSEDMGFQFWRGALEVRLTQVASEIDPQP